MFNLFLTNYLMFLKNPHVHPQRVCVLYSWVEFSHVIQRGREDWLKNLDLITTTSPYNNNNCGMFCSRFKSVSSSLMRETIQLDLWDWLWNRLVWEMTASSSNNIIAAKRLFFLKRVKIFGEQRSRVELSHSTQTTTYLGIYWWF